MKASRRKYRSTNVLWQRGVKGHEAGKHAGKKVTRGIY